jgi:hypothetical protein
MVVGGLATVAWDGYGSRYVRSVRGPCRDRRAGGGKIVGSKDVNRRGMRQAMWKLAPGVGGMDRRRRERRCCDSGRRGSPRNRHKTLLMFLIHPRSSDSRPRTITSASVSELQLSSSSSSVYTYPLPRTIKCHE